MKLSLRDRWDNLLCWIWNRWHGYKTTPEFCLQVLKTVGLEPDELHVCGKLDDHEGEHQCNDCGATWP